MADFNGVKFPIDPMIGVIGTAPDGEDVIDGFVGAHGGNLDNKLITKARVCTSPCACRARCCKWATCTHHGRCRAVRHGHRDRGEITVECRW